MKFPIKRYDRSFASLEGFRPGFGPGMSIF